MVNKYLALQKDVFDKSKITVVGNPTITSDGVASGFVTDTDYIYKNLDISNYSELILQNKFVFFKRNSSANGYLYWLNGIQIRIVVHAGGYVQFITEKDSQYYSAPFNEITLKDEDIVETKVIANSSLFVIQVKVNGKLASQKSIENLVGLPNITKVGIGASYAGKGAYTGSIDLKEFKIYVDNQLIYSPTKPTYLLERRKEGYDPSKFTVVGTPTITEYGVASGFSADNYIQVSKGFSSPFTLKYRFNTNGLDTSDGAKYGFLFIGNMGALYFNTGSYVLTLSYRANDNTTKYQSLSTRNVNTDYELTYSINGSASFINIKDLTNNTEQTYNLPLYAENVSCTGFTIRNFGCGSVDLKTVKITDTNNTLVFDGGADTYVYDPSKFTIVGSPTITEYGVASGFSSSNIIKSTKNIDLTTATSWSIACRANLSSTTISTIFSIPQDNKAVRLFTRNGSLGFNIPISDSDWGTFANSNSVLNLNVDYIFKLELKNGYYTSYYSLDGIDFIQGARILKEHSVFQVNPIQIGGRNDTVDPFNGSINLPSTSIIVDGKEVFTGAKENYYMLRR